MVSSLKIIEQITVNKNSIKFKMTFCLYKLIFKFLNLICILSIKFDGTIYSSPRSYRIKSFLLVFVSYLTLVERIYASVKSFASPSTNGIQITKFSFYFCNLFYFAVLFLVLTWIIILILNQGTIAMIFNICLNLKKFCEEKKLKINLQTPQRKILISFFMFLSLNILSIINSVLELKIDLKILVTTISYIFFHIFYTWCFWFFYVVLIHYDFLMGKLNEILENQFNLIHNNCENVCKNFFLIRILFNLLNRSFGVIFSFITLIEFLLVIFCVSRKK